MLFVRFTGAGFFVSFDANGRLSAQLPALTLTIHQMLFSIAPHSFRGSATFMRDCWGALVRGGCFYHIYVFLSFLCSPHPASDLVSAFVASFRSILVALGLLYLVWSLGFTSTTCSHDRLARARVFLIVARVISFVARVISLVWMFFCVPPAWVLTQSIHSCSHNFDVSN